MERRLHRIRDLWNEASDAQIPQEHRAALRKSPPGSTACLRLARLLSVLIGSSPRSFQDTLTVNAAGAANPSTSSGQRNYRTPIHLLNPLTGEMEDWATIAQATVGDTRVPYN